MSTKSSKKPQHKIVNKAIKSRLNSRCEKLSTKPYKVVKKFLKRAWACVGMCKHVWACEGVCGHVWACLGICGRVLACKGVLGHEWACIGVCGNVWECFGVSEHVQSCACVLLCLLVYSLIDFLRLFHIFGHCLKFSKLLAH